MVRFLAIVLSLAVVLAGCSALRNTGDGPGTPPLLSGVAEAVPAALCQAPGCLAPEEVETQLGFRPLEPSELNEGLILWDRMVPVSELPLSVRERIAVDRDVPLDSVPTQEPSNVAVLSYRFRGSDHVPAIWIYQELAEVGDAAVPTLVLSGPSCGDEKMVAGIRLVYVNGIVERQAPDAQNRMLVCRDGTNPRDLHSVMFIKDGIFVELQGFPEAGITKDDMLRMAASFP